MVKAWILSDLHCDHGTIPPPVPDEADILIAAGDIMNDEWLIEVSRKLPVLFVAGNHEFYKHGVPGVLDRYFESFTGGPIHFLENDTLRLDWCGHDKLVMSGATLWTDYNGSDSSAMTFAQLRLNDHRYISHEGGRFQPHHALALHNESIEYLRSSNADVIVTHHAPHSGSIHPRYEGQLLNYAYFSHALEKFDNPPRLWIHGHVHSNFDYMVGKTRVICNPHGYPGENRAFNPSLVVDI